MYIYIYECFGQVTEQPHCDVMIDDGWEEWPSPTGVQTFIHELIHYAGTLHTFSILQVAYWVQYVLHMCVYIYIVCMPGVYVAFICPYPVNRYHTQVGIIHVNTH